VDNVRTARIISGFSLEGKEKDAISARGGVLLLDDAAADENAAIASVVSADVWHGPGLTKQVLAAGGNLKWFQTATIGVEYFMYPELVESAVDVCNVRFDYSATADHAMTVMLALARALPDAVRQQSARKWQMPDRSELIAIHGRRLLVIGTGQIGSAVATRATTFGMDVHGVSRSGRPHEAFVSVVPSSELAEAVQFADWVLNACPLTPDTAGLVSREVLANVKPGVAFVNVGRGKTVDEEALIDHLNSGRIRAAALDVFAEEPLPTDSELWSMPNVLLTPHSAGMNPDIDSRESTFGFFLANLERYQQGRALRSVIDKRLGY
jgi:phosphoglycerate dehydrogenase-like enzyme